MDKPETTQIAIGQAIPVKDFAQELNVPVTKVIAELMKNGVMATINDQIDYDTAAIIGGELGFEVVEAAEEKIAHGEKEDKASAPEDGDVRPPIVAVMGHVDHGKTTLLDAIRKTDVAAAEAGGITQHLSAYQIEHKGRLITFLDTPGHEAFSLLREHGAHLTDVAVIVVAADEGIKPQTKEAIKFAQKAGVKIVAAITKIDKEGSDTNRIKQQLADENLSPEEWGGDTVTVEVSAKSGENVDKLIDMILLVADIEELRAAASGAASGTVIEAHMATGQGPLATLLVERGELKTGDYIHAGRAHGKVRTLKDTNGKAIASALPATPVVVAGWKQMPDLGEEFEVVANEKTARGHSEQKKRQAAVRSSSDIKKISHEKKLEAAMASTKVSQLPLVVKADVHGSLESLLQSIEALGTEEVQVKIVSQGVGAINKSDISAAEPAGAMIVGFNVEMPVAVKQLSQRQRVRVNLYKVIYELLDDVKAAMGELLAPEIVEETVAKLEIKGVFKITKNSIICGGKVTKGKLRPDLFVRRAKEAEVLGRVKNVQREQEQVKEVGEGELCGLQITTEEKTALEIGDKLEFFMREEKARSL